MLAPLHQKVAAGDLIVVYANRDNIHQLKVQPGEIFNNKNGHFHHNDIIGVEYGSKCFAKSVDLNTRKRKRGEETAGGYLHTLPARASTNAAACDRRTEILYNIDIALIVSMLEIKPGSVVLETGTGSGNLSTHLANALAPNGHLHTFEFHQQRADKAASDFARNGLSGVVTVKCRDTVGTGFPDDIQPGSVDAIFLDLPAPWAVVESSKQKLRINGNFCSFSPCIEQVQRTCLQLDQLGFVDIVTYECLERPYFVETIPSGPADPLSPQNSTGTVVATRPIPTIRGHTGYLTFARKSPFDE